MKINIKILFFISLFFLGIVINFYRIDINHYTSIQTNLFLEINRFLSEQIHNDIWLNITALGDALILFPLFSIVLLYDTRIWAALFASVPVSSLLSHIGKAFFAVPRPAAIINNSEFTIIGEVVRGATSLPSGHTITIFTAVTAVFLILLYGDKKIKKPIIWGIGMLLFASLVALSRVVVGAHWPYDLILGALFGFLGGLCGAGLALSKFTWWHWMKNPKYRYIHLLILLTLSIAMMLEYHQLVIAWLALIMAFFVSVKLMLMKAM